MYRVMSWAILPMVVGRFLIMVFLIVLTRRA